MFNPEAEKILADMRAEMYANPDKHFPDVRAARAMAEYLAVTRIGRGTDEIDREALRATPVEMLDLFISDADAPRPKLRDQVPGSAKTLSSKTRRFLSQSAEYGERVKNPLTEKPGRNWFGMSAAERKHLLAYEAMVKEAFK